MRFLFHWWLALLSCAAYHRPQALAKSSVHGVDSPSVSTRRSSAQAYVQALFLCLAYSRYGELRGGIFGCAGTLVGRSVNPAQFATLPCLTASGGDFQLRGVLS